MASPQGLAIPPWVGNLSVDHILRMGVAIALLYNIVFRIKRWYRLRHIPGPFLCGFTSLPLTWTHYKGTTQYWIKDLVDNYGPIVRTSPNEVLCADMDELHRISGPKSRYTKSTWYRLGRMTPGEDNVFSILDPERRRERKKMVAPAYAAKGTDAFEEGADRGISRWMDALETRYADTGVAVDMTRETHFATLDTLGEVAYSRDLGYLKNNRDMGDFLKINEQILPVFATLNNYTSFFAMMNRWPFLYMLPRAGDSAGFGAVIGFTQGIIDDRLKPQAKPKRDILQSFINSGLDRTALIQEVTIQFFAGSDTTANSINLLLMLLLTNPPAYRALQSELDAAHLSLDQPIRDVDAKSLPYLQACVREVLRLFNPLASGPFYKAVPPGGDTLCGRYFVPQGTRVNTCGVNYAMGREQKFWGEDAEHFRPERWFGIDEERKLVMQKRVDLAFGHGQFGCPGKAFALMEIGKAVGECLRRYDLSLVNFPVNRPSMFSAISWMIHDFYVRIDRRGSKYDTVGEQVSGV